ncbi:MAG TPA: nucleotide exchange factor GrpE [Candidatus Acidoferrales bacterium]|nr:nucleotide exchange factor GrpE [Candidatus Acidoferrales bacterium]
MASHKQHKDRDFAEKGFAAAAGPAEETVESQSAPDSLPADDGSSADQIQKLVAEKQDLQNTLVRRQADFENYRKRVEKERQQERHRGAEQLIEQVLPVLDAFDLALSGQSGAASPEYRKGFEIIRAQLWNALAKQGLQPIEAVGKPFDPRLHHAIENVPTAEQPEGTVVGEMQTGYMFHDRVLRPAMVRVATAPAN